MVTILTETRSTEVAEAKAMGDDLWLATEAAEAATGWALRPEGFCQGPVCVPIPPGREGEFTGADGVNVAAFWRHMGQPIRHDRTGSTWVLGAGATQRAQALDSLDAPDFTLPDIDGALHSLSGLRGKKVLLATWASW